jgi:hypothetical protein
LIYVHGQIILHLKKVSPLQGYIFPSKVTARLHNMTLTSGIAFFISQCLLKVWLNEK